MSRITSRIESSITDWVDANRERGLHLLQELVRVPSYSGNEGTVDEPESVVGRVFRAVRDHGTRVEKQSVRPASENVIEVIQGKGTRAVVLEAHTDTVPEGDLRPWFDGHPFSGLVGFVEYLGQRRVAIEVGGARYEAGIRDRMARVWELRKDTRRQIIYGRGSFDNKGPVVSTIMAMGALAAALAATGEQLNGSVIAAYTVDEEGHASGIRRFACGSDSWLAQQGYLEGSVDSSGFREGIWGIAMDGSYGWLPIVGHRGSAQFELSTHGRSAHAATPELGINAVEMMARLLLRLNESTDGMRRRLLRSLEAGLLGPPTFAIGTTIAGGGVATVTMTDHGPSVERAGINAVPNWCQATLDVRFPPARELSLPETVELVRTTLAESLSGTPGVPDGTYELKVLGYDPAVALGHTLEEAATMPLVRLARSRAAEFIGFEPHLESAPGGTDATFMIHEARIPTLVEFGPAGGLSHDVHEYVEADSVIDGAKILALTALDVLGIATEEQACSS